MSMLVKELEEQVGARLFDRTTRTLTLTGAGKRLQPVAERIVSELRSLGSAIEGSNAAVRQRLEVAATPMLSSSLLPTVMRDFADSHPQVQVNLADVDVGQVRRKVLEGEADLGLGFFVKPAVGLVRQPLCKFRLMRIRAPDAAGGGVRPSQPWSSLSEVPLVSLPADNPIQSVIEKQLARTGRGHTQRRRVNLIGTIISLVRAGYGDAVIPSFALDECVRQGLRVSMLREPAAHIDLYLVWQRGKQPSAIVMGFAEALKNAVESLPR